MFVLCSSLWTLPDSITVMSRQGVICLISTGLWPGRGPPGPGKAHASLLQPAQNMAPISSTEHNMAAISSWSPDSLQFCSYYQGGHSKEFYYCLNQAHFEWLSFLMAGLLLPSSLPCPGHHLVPLVPFPMAGLVLPQVPGSPSLLHWHWLLIILPLPVLGWNIKDLQSKLPQPWFTLQCTKQVCRDSTYIVLNFMNS